MNRPRPRQNNMSLDNDILHLLRRREIKENASVSVKRRLHVTHGLVMRLALEKELEGHTGCVNCLEWNETGRILASASDDLQVILWNPFLNKKLCSIQTGHNGNIFSVKFLPLSGDRTLVTGAGDCRILVHDVEGGATTHACTCHTGRVKRIATAPNLPFMFWSAGEDGRITQFDLRSPHSCSKGANTLVNLSEHLGRTAEAKCLAVNPQRPEQLAVGANDPFVRLYDRRMLTPSPTKSAAPEDESQRSRRARGQPSESESSLPPGCVQYFVAGHLPVLEQDYRKHYRNLASTYLTFGSNGRDLLVNLGGEQIYLFDVNNRRRAKAFTAVLEGQPQVAHTEEKPADKGDGPRAGANGVVRAAQREEVLPPIIEALKQQANAAFEGGKFTLAIALYNQAAVLCPGAAVLYGNRAAAYMKRLWDGDVYAAMRDCVEAIDRNPEHWKAHLRLSRCLFELRWAAEAEQCLDLFKARFPQNASDYACVVLEKELHAAKKTEADGKEKEAGSEAESSVESEPATDPTSVQERGWQACAYDYENRFCGHCNTTTDIKEANFLGGSDDGYIVGGSDDGTFFVWDRRTTNIVRVMKADDSIVNCLQPHPTCCMLASSGIDPVVRIWTPGPEDGSLNEREVPDFETAASANQRLMSADPLEVMLLNMGIPGGSRRDASGVGRRRVSFDSTPIQCQPC